MKNRKYISYIGLSLIVMATSCDKFLDRQPDNKINEETVFSNWDKVNGEANKLYREMRDRDRGIVGLQDFSISGITDECKGTQVEQAIPDQFNFGGFGPSIGMPSKANGMYWNDFYNSIRKANVFITGVEKYKSPDNPLDTGDLRNRVAEAHFFRAYFHWLAARWYGDIVYMDHVADLTANEQFVRQPWTEFVKKILADLNFAIEQLPARHRDIEYGRIDKGAAMALKAIVLYMNASPLYNGGKLPGNDTRAGKDQYASYDKGKWKLAADAAKALMDLKHNGNSRYSLYMGKGSDFQAESNNKVYARIKQIYIDGASIQNEWILIISNNKAESWQGDHIPPSYGGGSRLQPLQEQVDEYEFVGNDGFGYATYDPQAVAKGWDPNLPYDKRDPRFYSDIMYHGCTYQNKIINTATGADKIGASNATSTGYYLRKFYHEDWKRSGSWPLHFPSIRLPEIQLIYCEAMNKYSGPSAEIYTILNALRARSFMAPVPPGLNEEELHKYIQRERRVEHFYENKRYFYARWNLESDSPSELAQEAAYKASPTPADVWPYARTQRAAHGMRPVADPTGTMVVGGVNYKMQRFKLESRVFTSKNYYWPLVVSELSNAPTLKQSPNW
ncbi:RagB/SusD family nutrient uptake outer membrane protein [Paraflavitalea sp. CAU 1676]|uniref:RagB/SusD family nutrient uptake outer membrane protein n=1 Tax=Paraflavitalea sp. CAU 1676 TaxID=3032598 RepID=UPI0023DC47D6|nr:RagB/SusD family nutrient uptake outer membrane protein [Paraflavitalea sp. CAU 1676]MDF2188215.1 RagB/SusD family nutrient uptake outer membrane protein [Paraflavitalea sp. CAU 1676]